MRKADFGISVDVPAGWTATIARRPVDGTPPGTLAPTARAVTPLASEVSGERTLPVVHLCSQRLPVGVGDFGAGALEVLRSDDVFVALLEYGSDVAGQGLFVREGWPRLAPSQFSPNKLFRAIPGRSASQHFFSVGDRAFCLFTVVGSHSRRMATVPRAAQVVRSMGVEPAATMRRRGVFV